MGKFKSAMNTFGKTIAAMADHEQEVKELTLKLMSKTRDVEYGQAEKIARMLIAQAEVTWK